MDLLRLPSAVARPALLALFATVAATSVSAATLHRHVTFDRSHLRVEQTVSGVRVSMRGELDVESPGLPVLPMSVRSFFVPDGYDVASVRSSGASAVLGRGITLRVSQPSDDSHLPGASRPFPARLIVPKSTPQGSSAPNSGSFPRTPAVSLGQGNLAGHKLLSVAFFPVRWREEDGALLFHERLDVEIELTPSSRSTDLPRLRSRAGASASIAEALRELVANPSDLPAPPAEAADTRGPGAGFPRQGGVAAFAPTALPSVEGSPVDMVVLTSPGSAAPFQTLADWKTKKGVPAVVRTTDWVDANYPAGLDAPERTRLFLRDAYSKWGAVFVLLGGDESVVPVRDAYSRFFFGGADIATDQYYACLEGTWNADGDALFGEGTFLSETGDAVDLLPDVFVARAPVRSVAEAEAFVSKSITYDKSPPTGYVENVAHLAEVLFPDVWQFGDPPEEIVLDGEDLVTNGTPEPDVIDDFVAPSWARTLRFQSAGTLDRPTALAELNAGRHLVTHLGHSDQTKFSVGDGLDPFITTQDVAGLTNGDRLMVMMFGMGFSNSLTGASFGRALMNNPNGGAIAVFGCSNISFPLASMEHKEAMIRLAFENGITRFGMMSQLGRVPFAPLSLTDSTPDRWEILCQTLFADPELRLWTSEPESFVVSHPASVPLGSAGITVTVSDTGFGPVAGALVTLSDGSGTYARSITDAAGTATLPIGASSTGAIDVVVTKREFLAHESLFALTAVAPPVLALSGFTLDDDAIGASSGNADGTLDASETIELDLEVANLGGSGAGGVTATISVEAGTSATFEFLWDDVADPSRVFIGAGRANPAAIPFTLGFAAPSIEYLGTPSATFSPEESAAGDEGVFVWQDREGWHVRWSSGPDAVTLSGTVTTDGRVRHAASLELEAAETLSLNGAETVLTFSGTTHEKDLADGFDFALADGTLGTVTQAAAALGDIPAEGSASGTVVFGVASDARNGRPIYLDLELTSTTGGPWHASVAVEVAAPDLEAIVFTVDDSSDPPVSGNGNGVIEVGETVRLRPTVLNRGAGAADVVTGSASAPGGITFLDASDPYGDIASLGQSAGLDGYVFSVDDGSGTSIELILTDSVGRITSKTIEFLAPASPANLLASSTETSITLSWDPNAEADLSGYRVYRSETGGSGFTLQGFELVRAASRFTQENLPPTTSFYYRVAAVDASGNESVPSPELFAWTAQAQLAGWPASASSNVIASAAIANADGAGASEVFVGSKDFSFYGWDASAALLPGFPIPTQLEIWSTPALADIDGDGDLEIFFGGLDARFYAVHHDGTPVFPPEAWFVDLSSGNEMIRSTPSIADVNGDAKLEIFFGTDAGNVYAFRHDGTGLIDPGGLFHSVDPPGASSRIWGTIAIGDVDGDEIREIAFASWNDSLYVVEPDGSLEAGFPRGATGGANNSFQTGPVLVDLDLDGTMEILAGNNNGTLYAFDHDGSGHLSPDGVFVALPGGDDNDIRGVPACVNLDLDPEPEIVIGAMGTSGSTGLHVWNSDGTGFLDPDPAVPFASFVDPGPSPGGISASPIVVDVDGDLEYELLVGHRNTGFHGFHLDGSSVLGLPFPTDGEILSTAAAGDLDADGDVDVAFASFDGRMYVLDFAGAAHGTALPWPTYAGGNDRRSVVGEPGPFQTGVDVGSGIASFVLAQNAPNPFVAGTAIEFSVPRPMPITLAVFDVSGRLVRTLVRGPVEPGASRVVWDGRDAGGRAVSSGVYFYRLETEERVLTRKGVRLR